MTATDTWGTYPKGEDTHWTVDKLPDSEDELGQSNHYQERRKERANPPVTDEIVEELLTSGIVKRDSRNHDRLQIQKKIDGEWWLLALGLDTGQPGNLITIYCRSHG